MTNVATRFQPDISGSAVPSGFVGQVISSVTANANIPAGSASFGDVTSILLTAGLWQISGYYSLARNSATFTSTDIGLGITNGATSGTNFVNGVNYQNPGAIIPTSFSRAELFVSPFIVRCDGSTITRVEDNIAFTNSGLTLYLKLYVAVFTAGTPQGQGKLTAIRLA